MNIHKKQSEGDTGEEAYTSVLSELCNKIKEITERQDEIIKNVAELKMEQEKLREEIRLNNFILNNISFRKEILN